MDTVTEIIESVIETVCDDLCKYRVTADDDCICDYIREHGSCILDRLR